MATRWGTFLDAAEYHLTFIDQVVVWVEGLTGDSRATQLLKDLILNPNFKLQLLAIKNTLFLAEAIKKLETQGLSVEQQLNIVDGIKNSICLPDWAKQKYEEILESNCGLTVLREKLNSLQDLGYNIRMQFAPLTSVEVERSFSQYKYILSDRRTNLTVEHIEMMNMVMFNSHEEQSESASVSPSTLVAYNENSNEAFDI